MSGGIQATLATFAGAASSDDGRTVVLLFKLNDGRSVPFALSIEQFPNIVATISAVTGQAQQILGPDAPVLPAIPVESWSADRGEKAIVLSLRVKGGMELRFEVTPETTKAGAGEA